MAIRRIFGIEKNIFFLGLVSFFNDFSNEMIVSIFPAFFKSVLKSGAASLGLIEGIADGLANITKIFSGNLSDKIQKRKALAIIGYVISVATRPFYLIASMPAHVLGIRVADRIGKGFREAPRDALLSLSAPQNELGRSFGFHRAMDSLGSILGPLAAFFILRALPDNFNTIFVSAFIIGTLAVFSFIFVKEVSGVFRHKHHFDWNKKHPKHFKIFLASIFILSMGNLPTALLLLRTQDLGLTLSFIPLFYLFYNVSYTLFSYTAGKIADRLGDRKVIFTGYSFLCFSYLLIIYDHTLAALAAGFIVLGLFSALTDGVQRSYIARFTKEEERGSAYGYLNASIGFGSLLAGIVGGLLWQSYGPTTALSASVTLIILGLIVFSASNHQHQPKS